MIIIISIIMIIGSIVLLISVVIVIIITIIVIKHINKILTFYTLTVVCLVMHFMRVIAAILFQTY